MYRSFANADEIETDKYCLDQDGAAQSASEEEGVIDEEDATKSHPVSANSPPPDEHDDTPAPADDFTAHRMQAS